MPDLSNPRRRLVLGALPALAAFAALATSTPSAPPEVAAQVPGASLLGSGRLRVMLLHVYDARLWVGPGFNPADHAASPLALELEYARSLHGVLIAERSLAEMKRVGEVSGDKAQRWLAAMTRIFVDVNKGDRITGVQVPGIAARFFLNGQAAGEVRDADFTRLFFGIWLSARTSQPSLRDALLGSARVAP
jgi:hypothetical protein